MIVKTLGQGTFGITYLARVRIMGSLGSIDSDVFVAVKEFFMRQINGRNERTVTYSRKDGTFAYYKERFVHEAENLSKLNNPGIIKVIELFEENQTVYYVMEYISDRSLDDCIRSNGRLASTQCVDYAIQIATALSYMHQHKMLHLDLKPGNIMVRKDNKLVLIDFGLSKRFDADGRPETSTTIGHGTPGYAPLEQAGYQGILDGEFPSTMDVYALGGTMYKMLTGQRPPEASAILNEGFPYFDLQNIGITQKLVDIIARCMEPRRRNRYANTEDIISALANITKSSEDTELCPKGYFKRKRGESEYGTFEIENVPVTSYIDLPEEICIRLWDNSGKGVSYEMRMSENRTNVITVWDKRGIISQHKFGLGIPNDVKEYLISHGFLSTEHWEKESVTSRLDEDFGIDARILFKYANGRLFERRVEHAHPSYHNLLLNELQGVLRTTTLIKEIEKSEIESQQLKTERFHMPNDITAIGVVYTPGRYEGMESLSGFSYVVDQNSLSDDYLDAYQKFASLIKEMDILAIELGPHRDANNYEFAEDQAQLTISLTRKHTLDETTHSLIMVGSRMISGDIYGVNIHNLAKSIHRIFQSYLPEIWLIPDSVCAIRIDYWDNERVSYDNKVSFAIGKIKDLLQFSNLNYYYTPQEFNQIIDGLRSLKLRYRAGFHKHPTDFWRSCPSTGIVLNPPLSITMFDSSGEIIRHYYVGTRNKLSGNISVPMEKLKNELIKLSPTFRAALNVK